MTGEAPRIRRLPDDLANQIAAGEVVERPASVVKELVENAADAGATRVRVEIDQGGLGRILVCDDGHGMGSEDAELALERHATSKIATIEDLSALATYGFRGEALPSIASVCRLSLTTRPRESPEGVTVRVDGGAPARVEPAGCAPGTTIELRDLFYNVPARRKFLKSVQTESAHVGEVVTLAALARPDITFHLVRDGRPAREYLRAASRAERVAQAHGGERVETCIAERGPLRLEAYLGAPERARSGATGLSIFVNGRPVKDRQLARAVAQSYGSVLEPGRFPIGVVYVELPPERVDVNVHPQKSEVRFDDPRALFDAITRELYGMTSRAFSVPALGPTSRPWLPPPRPRFEPAAAFQSGELGAFPELGVTPFTRADGAAQPLSLFEPVAAPPSRVEFYSRLRFLAQLRATFLLCEGEDGLYVLDQHAAAERVTFHRLKAAHQQGGVSLQTLLAPVRVELTAEEVSALEGAGDSLSALGVALRALGPTAVAVHGVPAVLKRADPERIARDLAAELGRHAGRPFGGALDLVLATMACHGSVRAGDVLGHEEARALLGALDAVDFSGHCPHGRPVITRLGFAELERRVGR